MRRSRALLLAGALAVQTAVASHASPAPVPTLVIVELFTSEGCESCPPADRLLMDVLAGQPVPGATLVGLSEHVDYWNQLGWTDPFSSPGFSERQKRYAEHRRGGEVYTPQMIVDGGEPFVGSDRAAAIAAMTAAAARPKAAIGLAWAADASAPALTISINGPVETAGATVWLAVTEDGLTSNVTRGENEGHRLVHSAVTRQLSAIGEIDRSGRFATTRPLALDRKWKRPALRIVAFAQAAGTGRVVAAGMLDRS